MKEENEKNIREELEGLINEDNEMSNVFMDAKVLDVIDGIVYQVNQLSKDQAQQSMLLFAFICCVQIFVFIFAVTLLFFKL